MATASAFARSGLVGHPSDGYGGATLSVTLHNFAAEVQATAAAELDIAPHGEGQWPEGGEPLIRAAVARFERDCAPLPAPVRIRYRSTIPREVGLGGSSAIVIATLRALAQLTDTTITRQRLPAIALACETEELGIAAGLQDRVVQSYGGLVFMDFERDAYEPLDPALLPPLFVAWCPAAGGSSGTAHASVRARFQAGEQRVVDAMRTLARLAHEARAALIAGDREAFARALDAGYDVRASVFALDPRHEAMIAAARALGLSATYTGSGGAICGTASDPEAVDALRRRLHADGVSVASALVQTT
jgi:glucuronokinase